eukprot:4337560-Prymnesium_polylepis.1
MSLCAVLGVVLTLGISKGAWPAPSGMPRCVTAAAATSLSFLAPPPSHLHPPAHGVDDRRHRVGRVAATLAAAALRAALLD